MRVVPLVYVFQFVSALCAARVQMTSFIILMPAFNDNGASGFLSHVSISSSSFSNARCLYKELGLIFFGKTQLNDVYEPVPPRIGKR